MEGVKSRWAEVVTCSPISMVKIHIDCKENMTPQQGLSLLTQDNDRVLLSSKLLVLYIQLHRLIDGGQLKIHLDSRHCLVLAGRKIQAIING